MIRLSFILKLKDKQFSVCYWEINLNILFMGSDCTSVNKILRNQPSFYFNKFTICYKTTLLNFCHSCQMINLGVKWLK